MNSKEGEGLTPLHLAAAAINEPEVAVAMLEAGANVNAKDEENYTPLTYAATANKNPQIIIALLNAGAYGAAVNDEGETPFDLAKENETLNGTYAYWALNDARFK